MESEQLRLVRDAVTSTAWLFVEHRVVIASLVQLGDVLVPNHCLLEPVIVSAVNKALAFLLQYVRIPLPIQSSRYPSLKH